MKSSLFFLSAGLALTAAAQTTPHAHEDHDEDGSVVHLENFEVSTDPYGRTAHEIAQPIHLVDASNPAQPPALNLGDLVANEPGVSSTYFGPGAGRPIIRGMGGPRVAVLQNGTDMLDVSSLSPDHAVALDSLLIERVEITRGPAALLQGGSAIGGAVNVVSHRIHANLPEEGIHGRIEGRAADSNDELSGGIVLEGGHGQLAWHVDYFTRDTDDIEIPGYAESKYLRAEHGDEEEEHHDEDEHEDEDHDEDHEEHEEEEEAFGTLPNSFVETSGGALGLSWIGDNGYFGGAFSVFDTRYGIPPGAHAHEHEEEEHGHEGEDHDDDHEDEDHEEEEHAHGEEMVTIDMRQERLELEGEWRAPMAGISMLRFNAAWADYEHTEFEGDEVGTIFTTTGYDLRLEALHESRGGWQGAFGFELDVTDFDAVGAEAFLPAYDSTDISLFALEEFDQGNTHWQFGGRLEQQDLSAKDGSGRSHAGLAGAFSIGGVHDIDEAWNIATSVAWTQRRPLAQELWADGPHIGTGAYEIGDPTLSSETSLGLDLSLRHDSKLITGSLTLFVNDFDGYIYENPTGDEEDGLPVYVFSQHDALFYGGEATAVVHLIEDERGHLDLELGADYVRGTNETLGTDLPRVTPMRYRAGLHWQRDGWQLGTELTHSTGQDHLAPEEFRTDAYTLWSAYAGYRWIMGGTTWDLLLRGTNLGDEEARLHTSFLKDVAPLPGRNIHLSVRMSF